MTVLGGMGTLWGPIIGAALLVLLEDQLATAGFDGINLVTGLVFVVVVLLFRRGILGTVRHWLAVRRSGRAGAALTDPEPGVEPASVSEVEAARQAHTPAFAVHVRHGDPVEVWVDLEDGGRWHDVPQLDNWEPPREVGDRLVGEASFAVPAGLPLGYHTLRARSGADEAAVPLIVTPPWLGLPERLGDRRAWGLATQLYSVRSRQSWGVGDLADLAALARWAAGLGAGFVQ